MSGRRGNNRIRGPQSALTDFLATHNISAAQIRDDFQRRQGQAAANTPASAAPAQDNRAEAEDDEDENDSEAEAEAEIIERSRKRKRAAKAVASIKKAKALKTKHSSKSGKGKKGGRGKKGSDSDDDDDYDDEDLARDMYKKTQPLPGQFEHCEICNKRFAVTGYTKEGPDGGLLCTPCAKSLAKDVNAEKRANAPKVTGRRRRKLESDRLDGIAAGGARTLQQLCINTVAQHHEDIEELGELPQPLLERLSRIFSKNRVLRPKTLPLFLRGDLDAVYVHEAAYLEEDDYHQIFAIAYKMEKLVLCNACQFKDASIDYMLERCHDLKYIQLYAANLVTNAGWQKLFRTIGSRLEVLKLTWLDAAFEDATVQDLVKSCPNIQRLKLKLCRRIGPDSITAISHLPALQNLTLQLNKEIPTETLLDLLTRRGPLLHTLSLEDFYDADDSVLSAIHTHCSHLHKLRLKNNDSASDAGYTSLFTNWPNPPLTYIDLASTRDVDNSNPDGPDDPIGLASDGLRALMAHSGSALKHLDLASCRHIGLPALMDVFNAAHVYPALEYIDLSFCPAVDNSVVTGIFVSCPALKQLVTFCCFQVQDVVVPRAITLIGAPKAQDAIEQFGQGIGVDEAIVRMVEATAA